MIAFFVVAIMLLAPTVASAQGPGGSDEYVEQLPGAGGDQPSQNSAEDGEDPETAEPLAPAAEEALDEQGADGNAAAELAQATGPDGGGDSAEGGGSESGSGGGSGLPDVVGNVAGEADDSGMGVLLPLVIGGTVVAALAFVIVRRRRRHAGS